MIRSMHPLIEQNGGGAPAGVGSAPAPAPGAPGLVLDGVALPDALFWRGDRLRPLLLRGEPAEIAFFTSLPADEVIGVCAALAGEGARPRRREVRDRYVDTPDRELFQRGVSVRLREYLVHTRPLVFEVVAVSLRGTAREPGGRSNRVLVQTFERSDAEGLRELEAQHAAAGLVEVARVAKTRTSFDIIPMTAETVAHGTVAGADGRWVAGLARGLTISDLGVKVMVDQLYGDPFAEPTVIEVEYDAAHAARAAAVVERLRAALGTWLRPKERNKISYLLAP